MRVVVIILAVIGGLAVASVAGCVGCIGCAVFLAQGSTPEHFTSADISRIYGDEINAISSALAANRPLSHASLSAAHDDFGQGLVAIFPEADDNDVGSSLASNDVYGRYTIERSGYSLWNGVGALWLTVNGAEGTYAAYTVRHQGKAWVLALRDWQPEASAP